MARKLSTPHPTLAGMWSINKRPQLFIIILLSSSAIISILNQSTYNKSEPRTQNPVIFEEGNENIVWSNISGCAQFVTKFAKRSTLPRRALASFPGSGNTWLRFLIEGATGIYTGSVYAQPGLENGYRGEGRPFDDGSTILQKTHLRYHSCVKNIF